MDRGLFHPELIWVFPKIGVPQNAWENPIKMDDLCVPFFLETMLFWSSAL